MNRDWCNTVAPLTRWLMNATPINPLEPHTVCPRCRHTVLHYEVKDGWDLPEEKCPDCGSTLWRDGHDIGLELAERDLAGWYRNIIITIGENEEGILRNTLQEMYGSDWKLIQYNMVRQNEDPIPADLKISERTYVLLPTDAAVPFQVVDEVILIPDNDNICYPDLEISESVIFIDIVCGERANRKEPRDDLPQLSLNDLLKTDILTTAREQCKNVTGFALQYNKENNLSWLTLMPYYTGPNPGYSVQKWYEDEDISPFLPDRLTFSLLMKVRFASESKNWFSFWRDLISKRIVSVADIPASEEELYKLIRQKLEKVSIHDRRLAMTILDCMVDIESD